MVHLQSNLDHLSNLLVRKIEIYHDLFICAQKRVALINGPQLFFHKYGPAAQTSPELIFYVINTSQDASVLLSVIVVTMPEKEETKKEDHYHKVS